jgi:glycosyltransferase involved in cell wall biosynthesis
VSALDASLLRQALGVVAPGQPAGTRLERTAAAPGRARADGDHGRTIAASIRPGGRSLAVLDDRPLDPGSDSASHRLAGVIEMARRLGYETGFYSVRARRWYSVGEGATISPADGPPSAVSVAWVVRPEAGSIVVPALAARRPELRLVYDSMDVHALRLEREAAVTGSHGLRLQARLMRRLEASLASAADVAVAITDEEATLLRQLAGDAQVVVLPNVHEPRAAEPPPRALRAGLLFVGNYTHTPNVDAAEVLVREVMPRVWATRPELELTIAGRGLEDDRLGRLDPRVTVAGWVDDLDALVDRSLALVAPLRFGAGLKGKIGFALARGLPVVTTPVGAEGFVRPDGMLVAPDREWDEFAGRVADLAGDEALWAQTSRAGIELTRSEYAPDVLLDRLRQVLGE